MLARVRVLVTGGEHVGALAVVRGLSSAGHEPWALVPGRGAYAARSRAAAGWAPSPDPGADPDGFLAVVGATTARTGALAVLPGTEAALVVLAERAGELAPVLVGAPGPHLVRRATDKSELPALAAAAGLVTPPTREVPHGEAADVAAELGYPVIVKPQRSDVLDGTTLRHGTPRRADDPAMFSAALGGLPGDTVLVQPFLVGVLAAVCGVAWEGSLVCAVHQQARRIWPPGVGISAFAETVPPDAELEAGVARVLRALSWSGVFQAQFIRSRGAAYLIDLNPRPYGSLTLAIAAGLNLPAIWLALLAGERPEVGEYRIGIGYRSEERELQAVASMLRHGPRGEALHALLPRRRTTHAVAQLRDPLPALSSLAKLRR